MYSDITGIILSGGKSVRMGTNKALMKIGNETIIEKIVRLIRPLFPTILLSANTPEEYAFLNLPVIRDEFFELGPLAGIHSALRHAATKKIFVLSCDIPLMKRNIINYLCTYPSTASVVIAQADGFLQPLCGVYDVSLLSPLTQFLQEHSQPELHGKKNCRIAAFLKTVETEVLDIAATFSGYEEGTFFNMNNREEFEEITKRIGTRG